MTSTATLSELRPGQRGARGQGPRPGGAWNVTFTLMAYDAPMVHARVACPESEFRAADETTSLLHRREAAPSRFDTGQFSFRDAAQ